MSGATTRPFRRLYRRLFPPADPRTSGKSPYPHRLDPELGTVNGMPFGLMPMPDGSARLVILTADRKGYTFAATLERHATDSARFEAAVLMSAIVLCLGECTDLSVKTTPWATA